MRGIQAAGGILACHTPTLKKLQSVSVVLLQKPLWGFFRKMAEVPQKGRLKHVSVCVSLLSWWALA